MRSEFVDKFNHDDDAPNYDEDVLVETHPIRAGYGEVLDWVAARLLADTPGRVVELGSGTGNLTIRLPHVKELTCVDISTQMQRIAQEKLTASPHISYVVDISTQMQRIAQEKLTASPHISYVAADILEFFDKLENKFDAVISTYTIHHLTAAEKHLLFEEIKHALEVGGLALFGDLMFENCEGRAAYLAYCRRSGQEKLAEDIEDEFFWDVELALDQLQALGFEVQAKQFSELSWGLAARKLA
jgi:putative AdoMet-dependent methyltransferase